MNNGLFDMDEAYDACGDEIDRLLGLRGAFEQAGARSKKGQGQSVHATAATKSSAVKMPMMAKKAAKKAMKMPMKAAAKGAKQAVKRTMSEEGRKAIGDAVRARHAANKKAAANA